MKRDVRASQESLDLDVAAASRATEILIRILLTIGADEQSDFDTWPLFAVVHSKRYGRPVAPHYRSQVYTVSNESYL